MKQSSAIAAVVALTAALGLPGSVVAQTPGVAMAELTGENGPGKPVATFRIDGANAPAAVRAISPTGAVIWVALPGGGDAEGRPPLVLAMPCDCDVLPRTSLDGSVLLEMYAKGSGVVAAANAGGSGAAGEAQPEPDRPLRAGGENADPAPASSPVPARAPWVLAQMDASKEASSSEPLTDEAVEMAREQLLAQLTRAADQGILNLSDPQDQDAANDEAATSGEEPSAEQAGDADESETTERSDAPRPDLDTVADGLSASGLPLRVSSALDDKPFRSKPEVSAEDADPSAGQGGLHRG